MVQKQAANMRSQGDGFADDDPLAELARIVGFDQPLKREPVVSLPQAPDMGSVDFNLEDELMREFDGYEASPAPLSYAPPLSAPEPVVSRQAVADVHDAPRYREEPSFEPQASAFAVSEPAYRAPAPAYVPEAIDIADSAVSSADAYVSTDDVGVAAPEVVGRQGFAAVQQPEPELTFDLADELEFAVADSDIRPELQVEPLRPVHPEPPRLRLPLANFSAQPVKRAEPELGLPTSRNVAEFDALAIEAHADESPRFAAAMPPAGASPKAPADLDFGRATFDWASGPVEPIPAAVPPVAVTAEAVLTQPDSFAIEAERRAAPVASSISQTAPRIDREEPDFGFDFLSELAAEEDGYAPPQAVAPTARAAAPAASEEDFDPFADHEFDLQLDDIEIDLSDLDLAVAKAEPVSMPVPAAAASVAPVFAAPVASPRQVPSAPTTFAPSMAAADVAAYRQPAAPVSMPAYAAPVSRAAPVARASEPVAPVASYRQAAPVEETFSFDPSEISEQDDHLETLSGMDVPEVPVAEVRLAQPVQSDYDIDIDAELATLFEEPVAPPPSKPVASSRVAAMPVSTARPAAAPLDDFDAFEKALEEDFRSTMTSTGALEPESRGHITISVEGQGFRFRRIKPYLMAGTAVIVLLAGAGGLYAWLGSGAVGTLTGGEPQVIAADKSPVKIVPEDPGGKSVPNQDKAVYDRVAGNGVEDPKQQSLISSEEQPVDVVQRTLIPESLPMEGEDEALATPVGETEDPRLLPDGQPQQAAADDPATITPRKVRTMIVRPDGTLVAQEVPAEPTSAPAATTAATASQAAAEPPVLAPPSVPTTNTSDTVQTVETRVVTPGGPTEAAPAPAPVSTTVDAPAAAATTTDTAATAAGADAAAPRAPIPTSRPADQPVNVVGTVTDQGNLRPAQPAATAPAEPVAQTEVAAAPPAAATPAPAAAASAGSFGIQIASLPSEADAQKSYRNLSSKFSSVLGGKPWEIRQADIPGKGTFYRVRVVAGSKDDAVALCEQYRAAGGSCLVSR